MLAMHYKYQAGRQLCRSKAFDALVVIDLASLGHAFTTVYRIPIRSLGYYCFKGMERCTTNRRCAIAVSAIRCFQLPTVAHLLPSHEIPSLANFITNTKFPQHLHFLSSSGIV